MVVQVRTGRERIGMARRGMVVQVWTGTGGNGEAWLGNAGMDRKGGDGLGRVVQVWTGEAGRGRVVQVWKGEDRKGLAG